MPSELFIKEEILNDCVNVIISGEVDIYTSMQLKDKLYNLVDINKTDLKINCKDLNYIDSTGLGIFVGTLKKVRQNEKRIYILNLKDNIKKLFMITGLDKLFILED